MVGLAQALVACGLSRRESLGGGVHQRSGLLVESDGFAVGVAPPGLLAGLQKVIGGLGQLLRRCFRADLLFLIGLSDAAIVVVGQKLDVPGLSLGVEIVKRRAEGFNDLANLSVVALSLIDRQAGVGDLLDQAVPECVAP